MSTGKRNIFLDAFAANESGGNFVERKRATLGDLRERRAIHQIGDVIARFIKHAAETADRFLRATLITGYRNTINRRKDSVEVPHHVAHRDFRRIFGEKVAAANARRAVHPALRFEREHDLFEKPFGHVIAPCEFADGNRLAAIMIHQREQGAQSVIGSFRNSHTIKTINPVDD